MTWTKDIDKHGNKSVTLSSINHYVMTGDKNKCLIRMIPDEVNSSWWEEELRDSDTLVVAVFAGNNWNVELKITI